MPVSASEAKRRWGGNYHPYTPGMVQIPDPDLHPKTRERARRRRQVERGILKVGKQHV